ncbi:MAG: hypothetical protein BGP06_06510 [Rhizobiales bacterium 65-9]|nr:hypothetical protein [Hyphomicrobiales bacterium]OJY35490.1 MAG: hypothetical protein BGP06_06510 [Rhizobiales bacterium 65-9]
MRRAEATHHDRADSGAEREFALESDVSAHFVRALAIVLGEAAGRLEEIAGLVVELASRQPEASVVFSLQGIDRLRQELAALDGLTALFVAARGAADRTGVWSVEDARRAIEAVWLSDLKARLRSTLALVAQEQATPGLFQSRCY